MNLYWVTSKDHSEDWFVVSDSSANACVFFANYEGFDLETDEIEALFVCLVPEEVGLDQTDHANQALLEACGGIVKEFDDHDLLKTLSREFLDGLGAWTRVVLLNGVIYVEGNVARTWKRDE